MHPRQNTQAGDDDDDAAAEEMLVSLLHEMEVPRARMAELVSKFATKDPALKARVMPKSGSAAQWFDSRPRFHLEALDFGQYELSFAKGEGKGKGKGKGKGTAKGKAKGKGKEGQRQRQGQRQGQGQG